MEKKISNEYNTKMYLLSIPPSLFNPSFLNEVETSLPSWSLSTEFHIGTQYQIKIYKHFTFYYFTSPFDAALLELVWSSKCFFCQYKTYKRHNPQLSTADIHHNVVFFYYHSIYLMYKNNWYNYNKLIMCIYYEPYIFIHGTYILQQSLY